MKNREIKFRFWVKSFKRMAGPHSMWWNYIEYLDEGDCYVMQYTGLKDKNGKEIYEGDIVVKSLTIDKGSNGTSATIEWSPMASQWWMVFHFDKKRYNELVPDFGNEQNYCQYIEIIGNIYEHPDLL